MQTISNIYSVGDHDVVPNHDAVHAGKGCKPPDIGSFSDNQFRVKRDIRFTAFPIDGEDAYPAMFVNEHIVADLHILGVIDNQAASKVDILAGVLELTQIST